MSTLELDITERDRLLQSIRDELGSTQSENVALRHEIAALKKALLEGRSSTELTAEDILVLSLPPIPTPTPAATVPRATSPPPSLITANTQKDVASPRSGSFWGGASRMDSGITPVHTAPIPWAKSENINPALNAEKHIKSPITPGFDGFTDNNLFTMKNLEMYVLVVIGQRWPQSKCRNSNPVTTIIGTFFASDSEQITVFAVSIHQPLYSTPLHGLPSFILPDVAQGESPFTAFVSADDEQDAKHGAVRETIDLVPGCAWQEESPGAGTGVGRCPRWTDALGGAFWGAFSGSESESSRKLDVDKVRRVLEGKVVVQIVDVNVEPWKEVGCTVSRDACSVAAILGESMKSLTFGKK
ncbi:hypothetical protein EDD85DRAFT_793991 [Armillaria nabsnona]|nr:hypothetical protein EDD85DRAFT_793991 [Armillaria nabsnona]